MFFRSLGSVSRLHVSLVGCHPCEFTCGLQCVAFVLGISQVIGHYYAGCTPGREDQPAFSQFAAQKQFEDIAFLETLKARYAHLILGIFAAPPRSTSAIKYNSIYNGRLRILFPGVFRTFKATYSSPLDKAQPRLIRIIIFITLWRVT
jgi:hypothetical protein